MRSRRALAWVGQKPDETRIRRPPAPPPRRRGDRRRSRNRHDRMAGLAHRAHEPRARIADRPGVPASLTSATLCPALERADDRLGAPRFVVRVHRQRAGRRRRSGAAAARVTRVSSAAIRSAVRRTSSARSVRSRAFPSGVATTYNDPGIDARRGAVVAVRPVPSYRIPSSIVPVLMPSAPRHCEALRARASSRLSRPAHCPARSRRSQGVRRRSSNGRRSARLCRRPRRCRRPEVPPQVELTPLPPPIAHRAVSELRRSARADASSEPSAAREERQRRADPAARHRQRTRARPKRCATASSPPPTRPACAPNASSSDTRRTAFSPRSTKRARAAFASSSARCCATICGRSRSRIRRSRGRSRSTSSTIAARCRPRCSRSR